MSDTSSRWMKIGVAAGFILLLVAAVIMIKFQMDIAERQNALEQNVVEMKQLQDGIVRSEAKYVTKEDLEKFAKDNNINLEIIRKDLAKLGAEIKGINVIISQTPGYNGHGLPSTGTSPGGPGTGPVTCPPGGTCPNPDPFGYMSNAQHMALFEPFSSTITIPFGETVFRAWMEKPWDVTVFPRKYAISTVISQDEDGDRHYTHNKFTIETQGKVYEVPISDAQFVEKFPEPSFHVNPRIHLGVGVGVHVGSNSAPVPTPEFTPGLEVFVFSYGKTKKIEDTEWSLLGLGVGFETQKVRPALIVSPAKYNIGHAIPYIDNLHVGPAVTVDTSGEFSVMAEISVGL